MFSFREAITQKFINQLINSSSVDDFSKILLNYIQLPDILILRVLLRENITEFEKIAISMAFTDLYFDMNSFIANLYTYFCYKLKQDDYQYREEVKIFAFQSLFNLIKFKTIELDENVEKSLLVKITNSIRIDNLKQLDVLQYKIINKVFGKRLDEMKNKLKVKRFKNTGLSALLMLVYTIDSSYAPFLIELIINGRLSYNMSQTSNILYIAIRESKHFTYNTENKKRLIHLLKVVLTDSTLKVQMESRISLWYLTNHLKYLKIEEPDMNKKYYNLCEKILSDPQSKRDKIQRQLTKHFEIIDKIQLEIKKLTLKTDIQTNYEFSVTRDREKWICTLSGNDTLDDLADYLISLFDLLPFHMYAFFMNNKIWDDYEAYYCPDASEGPFTSDYRLCQLSLHEGKIFTFLFDFGSEFTCKVSIKSIRNL